MAMKELRGVGVDSEYNRLGAVLLYMPGPEIGQIKNPKAAMHISRIDPRVLDAEYSDIIKAYKQLKIRVYFIEDFGNTGKDRLFNLMYARDLFFMTPKGAIVSRMAFKIRKNEPRYAEKALKKIGIPVRKIIDGSGTFEGADALWLNKYSVIVGVGNRTNARGFRQVREELKAQGVGCVSVPAPSGTQHLLGALQFIGTNAALIRRRIVDSKLVKFLKENKIYLIDIPENKEVKEKQAMNIVVVNPREIVMGAGCPLTRRIYERNGIKIVAQLKMTQLINGAGGLACATGIIGRRPL